MKIPAHFDPSIGIKSISVKESKSAQTSSKGSVAENQGVLSLALTSNFPTNKLNSLLMESLKPELHAAKGSWGARLKDLSAVTEQLFPDTELLSFLQEECKRQEILMEARQKNVGS